jgi:hypothetical protein
MRKIPWSLILTLLIAVSVVAQRKTDRERESLIGNVHTVRTEYKILSKTSGKEELIGCPEVITYDSKGLKIEAFDDCFAPKISTRTIFSYNEMGRLVEMARYSTDKSLLDKTIYTYDASKKTVRADEYRTDDSLFRKVVYTFPSDYDLDKVDGFSYWDTSYFVHHWIEVFQSDADGSFVGKQTAVNKNGRREEILQVSEGSRNYQYVNGAKTVYLYDSTGKITSRSFYSPDGTLNKRETWVYDRFGNRIKSIDRDSSGKEWSRAISKYNYDSMGNWVKMTFSDLGTTQVQYRTITYY